MMGSGVRFSASVRRRVAVWGLQMATGPPPKVQEAGRSRLLSPVQVVVCVQDRAHAFAHGTG